MLLVWKHTFSEDYESHPVEKKKIKKNAWCMVYDLYDI